MHALRYRFANVFRVDALQRFGDDIWIANGPTVHFFGAPLPTRMVVVKLADGSLWIDSPVVATAEQVGKLAQIGPVAHLVSPTAARLAIGRVGGVLPAGPGVDSRDAR